MGRFYQTSAPRFVDENIYEAPMQLMQGVLGNAESRTDAMVNQSELLEGATDQISHLNFNADNERVSAIQGKYTDQIEDITQNIASDPLNYSKHNPQLKKLRKEMLADRTTGEWSQIEGRFNDYQGWVKDNEDLRESNPTLYNRLNQEFYSDVVERASGDAEARFQGQKGIDKPDLIEGYRAAFENIKESAMEYSDGKYKINNTWLSEDEVANIAWNTLLSDKNYAGYANQMGNILGDEGYFNEDGSGVPAFNLVDGNGNVLSFEDYQNLSDEDKAGVTKELNPNNAFYSDLSAVSQTYSFTEREVDADPYGIASHRGNITSGHINQRAQNAFELESYRQQGRHDLLDHKYSNMADYDRNKYKGDLLKLASEGDVDAQNTLNRLIAKETIGVLVPPPASLSDDRTTIDMNREANGAPNDGKAHFTAQPGTTEYAAQQRWKNSTEFAMTANGKTKVELSNGSSFDAQEYFDWLGPRESTEETAKTFLENKKGVYVREGASTSFADDVANNARWMPEFMKSDAAVDWDKLYEVGQAYEESRGEWYTDVYTKPSQLSLQPVTNATSNISMLGELRSNPGNYYMVAADGTQIDADDKDATLIGLPGETQIYVTSANSYGQMGMETTIEGQKYYIFPNEGNDASSNIMINLSMEGVDQNSQYFNEMSNRVANGITQDLNASGENSAGTKTIVTKVNGKELSLELVGDKVYVREPNANLNSEPKETFDNMQHFVNSIYAIE